MKQTPTIFFLLALVFRAPADAQQLCPDGITKIGECPDEGCRKTAPDPDHQYDPELDKRKNVRSDDQQPVLRSIRWIKFTRSLVGCDFHQIALPFGRAQFFSVTFDQNYCIT
jgi:hypothetical protein